MPELSITKGIFTKGKHSILVNITFPGTRGFRNEEPPQQRTMCTPTYFNEVWTVAEKIGYIV